MRTAQRLGLLLGLAGLALAGAGGLLAARGPAAEEATLDDLSFIAGHWRTADGAETIEEAWLPARGGMMIGVSRTSAAGRPTQFEFLRIELRDGAIAYVAAPGGKRETVFPLKSLDRTTAVFENPQHDFPKRIRYERDGSRLTARIEGDGDQAMSWTWKLATKLD